jgi:hypothetical protein
MRRSRMLVLLLIFAIYFISGTTMAASQNTATQNLTEHTWTYNQGYMDDMRIYQTDAGFKGQKLVTGTRGSGTVSRTIDARVYGGFEKGNDSMSVSEWGVFQYKPYTPPLTQSDLKNALCSKNYEVGSVISESYSEIRDLIKDTKSIQTDEVSVYEIDSEIMGTAKIGSRVQKRANTAPIYVMGGTYIGYSIIRMDVEAGNASILTLPCP